MTGYAFNIIYLIILNFVALLNNSSLPFLLISRMNQGLDESSRKLIVKKKKKKWSVWAILLVLACCLQHARPSQLRRTWSEMSNFVKGPLHFFVISHYFLRTLPPPLPLSVTNLGYSTPIPSSVTSFLIGS